MAFFGRVDGRVGEAVFSNLLSALMNMFTKVSRVCYGVYSGGSVRLFRWPCLCVTAERKQLRG